MDAVRPFLLDAAVLLPWLSLIGCVRRVPWFAWLAVGAALIVTLGCAGCLTYGGMTIGAVGTCGVLLARELGMPPRMVGPLAAAVGGLAIACSGFQFYETRYVPWITNVRAAQERYPAVPRSSVLPPVEADRLRFPAESVPDDWDEAFPSLESGPDSFVYWNEHDRADALRLLHGLHDDFHQRFSGQLGFGNFRMGPTRRDPAALLSDDVFVPQFPQPGTGRLGFDGGLDPLADDGVSAALAEYHTARGIDFANAPGFGVLARGGGSPGDAALPGDADPADGPFLIGFRPHAARTDAGGGPLMPAWRLHRVELIGLILHDEPVGYASESLPRMGETATHAVRPLTEFEAAALPKLAAGEWVHAAADRYRLRALGALPAAKACAECHGVPVGTLLGALSYDFLREAE